MSDKSDEPLASPRTSSDERTQVSSDVVSSDLMTVKDGNKRRTVVSVKFIKKIVQTLTYYLIYISYGCNVAAIGPALPLLAKNSHTNVDKLGWLYTSKAGGGIIGALIAGKLYDIVAGRSSRAVHLLLGVCTMFMAVCLAVIPFMRSFWSLICMFFIYGISINLANIGCCALTAWTWKKRVTTFYIGLALMYGVGATISPFLVTSGVKFNWLYWILALMVASTAVFLFFTQTVGLLYSQMLRIRSRIAQSKSDPNIPQTFARRLSNTILADVSAPTIDEENVAIAIEELQEKKIPEKNRIRLTWDKFLGKTRDTRIAITVGLALFGVTGLESGFGGLLYTYLTEKKIAAQTASVMLSVYFGAFTGTRFLVAPIAAFIHSGVILIFNIFMTYVSICMFLFLPKSMGMIWAGIIIMGIGISTQSPTSMSYPQSAMVNVQLTATMTAMMTVISSLGEMIIPISITSLFKKLGPDSLFWILLGDGVLPIVIYSTLIIWSIVMKRQARRTEEGKAEIVMAEQVVYEEQEAEVEAIPTPTSATTPLEAEPLGKPGLIRRYSVLVDENL
jgi:MFS family permease